VHPLRYSIMQHELDIYQQKAVDKALKGHHVFITGVAGTGKSYLIKQLTERLRASGKSVQVTATTGIAAVNLPNACTLHYWAGLGVPRSGTKRILAAVRSGSYKGAIKSMKETQVLVIDEASMLSGEYFELLAAVAKTVLCDSVPETRRPAFGGIQIIFCGDFWQLPPVCEPDDKMPYVFQRKIWKELDLTKNTIELRINHRQCDDVPWRELLGRLRLGRHTREDVATLRSRCIMPNDPNYCRVLNESTILFPTRKKTQDYNDKQLQILSGETTYYIAKSTNVAAFGNDFPYEEELKLKMDTPVLLLRNVDVASGLVNGARGKVVGFARYPLVAFSLRNGDDERTIEVEPHEVAMYKNNKPIATFCQIPLKAAWALTVHKAQGMTLQKVVVEAAGTFESGQMYVALSRVPKMSGVYIMGHFSERMIKTNANLPRSSNAM
jgi:ATP-dependent DNA helicase PIF1